MSLRGFSVAHLKRREQHRPAPVSGDVARDLQAEQALAHRRARRDHVQPAVLQPAEQAIELRSPVASPGISRPSERRLLQPVDLLIDGVLEQSPARSQRLAAELEDLLLGRVDHLRDRVAAFGDLAWIS